MCWHRPIGRILHRGHDASVFYQQRKGLGQSELEFRRLGGRNRQNKTPRLWESFVIAGKRCSFVEQNGGTYFLENTRFVERREVDPGRPYLLFVSFPNGSRLRCLAELTFPPMCSYVFLRI